MLKFIISVLLSFLIFISGIAQTPQPPSFHGGNPNRVLDLQNPANSTLVKVPEFDYSKQNPRFRSMIPRERKCVTVEMDSVQRAQHASEKESVDDFENWLDESIRRTQRTRSLRRMADQIYTLPVVIHVIYSNPTENISDEQIMSQMAVLNEDYRRKNPDKANTPRAFGKIAVDPGIEFCLASVDEQGNPTTGINRVSMSGSPFSDAYINEQIKPNTIWNPNEYLNIWVCNIRGGILGYAQFPSSSGLVGLPGSGGVDKTDGVVINYNTFGTIGTVAAPFDRGRTATHEIGHWLGLRHVWGDGPCGTDDYCDDTPEADGANFACPNGLISCDGSTGMAQNFMDYTDDACMNLFTRDQRTRMRSVLENSPRRKSLLNSRACDSGLTPPEPAFTADVRTGCGPLRVKFKDQSDGDITQWVWSFPGGKPSGSKKQNPEVVYKKPGIYPVSLRVSNPSGNQSLMKDGYIFVVGEGESLPLTISFEKDEAFPPAGFTLNNPDEDITWKKSERVGGHGLSNGALLFNNFENNLRNSVDWLISPVMDFSGGISTTLSFDIAYAPHSEAYSDTLGVFIAAGCSPTFRCIYYKGGETLSTVDAFQNAYKPLENEWRNEVIDLSAYDGQPFVRIAVVNFSGYGNDLFLDNFRLYSTPKPVPVPTFSMSDSSVCSGTSVQFNDQTEGEPTALVWSFPGGIPASDTTANPSVTYPNPGIYDVILTVSNSSGSKTITRKNVIQVKAQPDLNLDASQTEICAGEEVTLQASGLDNYNWDLGPNAPIPTSNVVSVLPVEDITYKVSGRGDNGCEAVASVTIRIKEEQTMQVNPSTVTICPGSSANLSASGAVSYAWSPADGLSNTNSGFVEASPSVSTTYIVTGITASGCEITKRVTVNVEDEAGFLDITALTRSICPGESLELTASGGASYTWFPAASLNTNEGATVLASPSETTTYRVAGVTENGCISEQRFTVNVSTPPVIKAFASRSVICKGATVILNAAGANQYFWTPFDELDARSGPSVAARPTTSTTFEVIGANLEGCLDTTTVSITVNEAEPVSLSVSDPVICKGGSTMLSVSGAREYRWSPAIGLNSTFGSRVIARPTRDVTYKVIGRDENGCQSQAEALVKVSQGFTPLARFSTETSTTCVGQETRFLDKSTNAVEYYWEFPYGTPATSSEKNPVVVYQREGVYDAFLTVRSCNGRENRTEMRGAVAVTGSLNFNVNVSDITVCKDVPQTLTATGADTYTWSPSTFLDRTDNGTVIANPSSSITYRVTGTNMSGCSETREVRISVIGQGKNLRVSPGAPVICTGEAVELVASGASVYEWSPRIGLDTYRGERVMASPTETTTYTVLATDIDGCTFTEEVLVTVRESQEISITPAAAVVCEGKSVSLRVDGQGVFQWSPEFGLSAVTGSEVEAFPSETTEYTVTGTDQNGCRSAGSVVVTVNRQEPISVSAQDQVICAGAATLLTAEGGSDFRWSPATGLDKTSGPLVSASPSETTTYTVVSGEGGCGNEKSVTVEVIAPKAVEISPPTARICKGNSLALQAYGGTSYVWDAAEGLSSISGANVSVTPEQTTSYTVRSIDDNNCEIQGAITVVVEERDFLRTAASARSICENEEVILRAEGGKSYRWTEANEMLEQDSTLIYPEKSQIFRVVGRSEAGCLDTAEVFIEVSRFAGGFEMTTDYIDLATNNGLVQFTDKSPDATSWVWDFGIGGTSREQHPTHVYTEVGTYLVTLRVSNGICEEEIQKQIVVDNTSSLDDLQDGGSISVSAQTANGLVDVAVESPREMYLEMRLLNNSGIQLLSSPLRLEPASEPYQQQLDLSEFDRGTYYIQLTDGEETLTRQVQFE